VIGVAGVHTRNATVALRLPTLTTTFTEAALLLSAPSSDTIQVDAPTVNAAVFKLMHDSPLEIVLDVPVALYPTTVTELVTLTPFRIAVFTSSLTLA